MVYVEMVNGKKDYDPTHSGGVKADMYESPLS